MLFDDDNSEEHFILHQMMGDYAWPLAAARVLDEQPWAAKRWNHRLFGNLAIMMDACDVLERAARENLLRDPALNQDIINEADVFSVFINNPLTEHHVLKKWQNVIHANDEIDQAGRFAPVAHNRQVMESAHRHAVVQKFDGATKQLAASLRTLHQAACHGISMLPDDAIPETRELLQARADIMHVALGYIETARVGPAARDSARG